MKRWFMLLLLLCVAVGAWMLIDPGSDERDPHTESTGGVAASTEPPTPAPPTEAESTESREVVGAPEIGLDPLAPTKAATTPTIEGARVEGTVSDGYGRPLAGVRVSLLALEGTLVRVPRDLARTTTSENDGRFRFGDLPQGVGLAIRAEAPGFATAELEFAPPSAGESRGGVDLRLDPAITLTGTVTRGNGAPLGGADVVVELASSPFGAAVGGGRTTATDDRGRYAVSGLSRSLYRVTVNKAGFAPRSIEKSLFAVTLRPEATLDVSLDEASGSASGRVVDDTGRTVPGARIVAEAEGHEVQAVSGGDGRFRIDGLADRSYSAVAHAPRTFPLAPVRFRPGENEVVLVVGTPGALVGRARLQDGGEPTRIAVELLRITRTEAVVARTVFDGPEFRFEDLAPGSYRVAIECDGARRTLSDPIAIDAAEHADLGDVGLRVGGFVIAQISGAPDGTPATLVEGDLSPANPSWAQRSIFAPSSQRALVSAGRARFENVMPGAYTLFVVPEKGLPTTARGVVVADDATTTIETEVHGPGAAIRGRAIDVLGAVITDREVIASGPGGEMRVRTDPEGYFAFAALAPGEWTVTLEVAPKFRGSPRPARVDLAAGDSIEVELRVDP